MNACTETMNYGVHATHCCKKHGCKYGNDDCPVVSERVSQEHPCESCQYSQSMPITEEMLMAAIKKAVELGVLPKYGTFDDLADSQSKIRQILQAALDSAA